MSEALDVRVLTAAEQEAVMAEIARLYGALDNPAIDHLINTPALMQRDRRDRPIISLRQHKALSEKGERLDAYFMRVANPFGQISLVQASKLQKYRGNGYLPIEEYEEHKKEKEEIAAKAAKFVEQTTGARMVVTVNGEPRTVVLYPCADKYPGCERLFDRAKGRESHWRTEHEKQKLRGKKDEGKRTRKQGSEEAG